MKKAVMLPLVAAISGAMVGCGGGGGGEGGSNPGPSYTNYTFSFFKPVEADYSSSSSCTIFDKYTVGSKNKVLNYYTVGTGIDGYVKAFYSDDLGNQIGESITAKNGKVTVALEKIPTDGFVTVQEQWGTLFVAQTFTKEVLTSDNSMRQIYLSSMNTPSGGSCLTGNNDSLVNLSSLNFKNDANLPSNDPALIQYHFNSQVETLSQSNPTLSGTLSAVKQEKTSIHQYRDDGTLYQYGFNGWNSNEMVYAGNSKQPVTSNSYLELGELALSTVYQGFSYSLVTLDLANVAVSKNFFHPDEKKGESWVFTVQGRLPALGWDNAIYSDLVDENWLIDVNDSSLVNLNNTNNAKPSVTNEIVDVTSSIDVSSTEHGLQRIAYNQSAPGYTVKHSIYSHINSSIRVPRLDLSSVGSSSIEDQLRISSSADISQGYLFTENDKDVPLAEFMTKFRLGRNQNVSKDTMSIVEDMRAIRDIENNLSQTKSLMISRYN